MNRKVRTYKQKVFLLEQELSYHNRTSAAHTICQGHLW